MPSNPTIPTLATGNVLSSSAWNDLTYLNGAIALHGAGSVLAGGAVATSAPNFQVQAGFISATTSAGGQVTVTFPSAFSTNVLSVQITGHVGACYLYNALSTTVNGFTAEVWYTGTSALLASTTVQFSYVAIGA